MLSDKRSGPATPTGSSAAAFAMLSERKSLMSSGSGAVVLKLRCHRSSNPASSGSSSGP